MSEYEEQFNEADYIAPLGLARLAISWIGAITSIALVVGLAYWVFQLGTRDPNEIPIIRAMAGPARTQPDNPGGTLANHQGLAVNAIQSEGSAEKAAETVVLAPRQQSLTQEDKPLGELAKTKPILRKSSDKAQPDIKPQNQEEVEEAIIAAVKVNPTVQDKSLITESIVIKMQSTVISSSDYAPLKSPIPPSRPNKISSAIKSATGVASQPAVKQTDVPAGTRLVQLGAFDSKEIALKEWDKIIGKHGDLMADKKQFIQTAFSGGKKFYRLRATGFETLEDSRNLCAALLARGTSCIPVTKR